MIFLYIFSSRLTPEQCYRHPWLRSGTSPRYKVLHHKKQLSWYVNRWRWKKSIHTVTALQRMGASLAPDCRKKLVHDGNRKPLTENSMSVDTLVRNSTLSSSIKSFKSETMNVNMKPPPINTKMNEKSGSISVDNNENSLNIDKNSQKDNNLTVLPGNKSCSAFMDAKRSSLLASPPSTGMLSKTVNLSKSSNALSSLAEEYDTYDMLNPTCENSNLPNVINFTSKSTIVNYSSEKSSTTSINTQQNIKTTSNSLTCITEESSCIVESKTINSNIQESTNSFQSVTSSIETNNEEISYTSSIFPPELRVNPISNSLAHLKFPKLSHSVPTATPPPKDAKDNEPKNNKPLVNKPTNNKPMVNKPNDNKPINNKPMFNQPKNKDSNLSSIKQKILNLTSDDSKKELNKNSLNADSQNKSETNSNNSSRRNSIQLNSTTTIKCKGKNVGEKAKNFICNGINKIKNTTITSPAASRKIIEEKVPNPTPTPAEKPINNNNFNRFSDSIVDDLLSQFKCFNTAPITPAAPIEEETGPKKLKNQIVLRSRPFIKPIVTLNRCGLPNNSGAVLQIARMFM